jgi:hypothetical protein
MRLDQIRGGNGPFCNRFRRDEPPLPTQTDRSEAAVAKNVRSAESFEARKDLADVMSLAQGVERKVKGVPPSVLRAKYFRIKGDTKSARYLQAMGGGSVQSKNLNHAVNTKDEPRQRCRFQLGSRPCFDGVGASAGE